MYLTVVPLDDATWPGPFTVDQDREPSRFSAAWSTVMADLDREVDLTAKAPGWHTPAVLEVPFPKSRLYRDGTGVHADAANARHPGVALSFDIHGVGPVRFACDRYRYGGVGYLRDWQSNVRAVVLTLEALRAVDRHGAAKTGQQYRGFAELGAGTPVGAGMDRDVALGIIAGAIDWSVAEVTADLQKACRLAIRSVHPDHGGDRAAFDLVTEARDLLVG